MPQPAHVPVMAERAVSWLVTDRAGRYWDATVGAAGHAAMIADQLAEGGELVGSDRDSNALNLARAALAGVPVTLVQAKFSQLAETWERLGGRKLQGILFDFGIGSFQLDDPARGISFELDGPLDMRMGDTEEPLSARLDRATEEEIADVIFHFGEERKSRRIARAIAAARPLHRTGELRSVVESAVPPPHRIKTLARVFQALRIWSNDELEEIRQGLSGLRAMLGSGGRVVAISYHSLEDRIVKQFFRRESVDCICPPEQPVCTCEHRAWLKVLTRKAEVPTAAEIEQNSRARSAKLRVAECI